MNIDYVIVSSDNNRMYFDFWDIVKDIWINKIKIKPILVLISDEDNVEDYGDFIIHKLKKVENINTGFQSQISRMYISRYYKNKNLLTSDIDMIPLNPYYFKDSVIDINHDNICILSSDAYKNVSRYPICYNVAMGQTFCDILECDIDFELFCNKLIGYNWGWETDELYFGMKVDSFNQLKVIKKNRGWNNGTANKRIDRFAWNYDIDKVKNNYYIDCHSLRPLSQYENEIKKLISL